MVNYKRTTKKNFKRSLYKAMIKLSYGKEKFIKIKLDKNYQVAEIYPIIPVTRSLLNIFRGRPYKLCQEDLHKKVLETLKIQN